MDFLISGLWIGVKSVSFTVYREKWNRFYIQCTGVVSDTVLWLNKSKKMIQNCCCVHRLKVVTLAFY
jgi:hypothetical protein